VAAAKATAGVVIAAGIGVVTGAVIAAVTAVVAADGAVVVDAIAADARRRARALAVAISRLPNTLPRKAAILAATSRAVTIIVDAINEVRKTAAARHAVLSLVARRSVALTIARPKLPVPPHPVLSRKNPFFFPASLSQSIVASPLLRLRLPWPSRKFANRSLSSMTRLPALPALSEGPPFLPPDLPAERSLAASPADFPAGFSPTPAPNPRLLPFPLTKISALPRTLPFPLTAQIRRGTKPLRSNCPYRPLQIPQPCAAKRN
jgi:hypothetical protein